MKAHATRRKTREDAREFDTPLVVTTRTHSGGVSTITKQSVATANTSTSSSSGDKDPDLSQNLLESQQVLDDDAIRRAGKGISKELNFSNYDNISSSGSSSTTSVAILSKKQRLSTVAEGSSAHSPSSNSVQTNVTPGGHGFPKASNSSSELTCAAIELCVNRGQDILSTSETCICINCNFTAHLGCAQQLFVQVPSADGGIDYRHHLSVAGKGRLSTFTGNKDDVMLCLSCTSVINNRLKEKAVIISAPVKGKNKPTYESAVKIVKAELTRLAVLYAMSFVYGGEAKNNADKQTMLRDHFYGTKDLKGSAQQLIDGDGVFHQLYEVNEGEDGEERRLKHIYCHNHASTLSLVIGRDITVSDITTISKGAKQLANTTLWSHATNTLKSCKKAMTLVPRLAPKMIQIDRSKYIVGYSSGINYSSFLQSINNGMYIMEKDAGFIRSGNKQSKKNDDDVDDDNSIQMMDVVRDAADWDPFEGVEAPDSFMFLGFIAFAVIGPGAHDAAHFSPLLRANVKDDMTKEERKEMSRSTLRSNNLKSGVAERQSRQSNEMNMQTKCDIATIALAKAESEERAEDRNFLALNTEVDAKRLEIDLIGKLLTGCDDDEELQELRSSLRILRTEIRQLTSEIAAWKTRAAAPNTIVNNLLYNAETMMGIKPTIDKAASTNGTTRPSTNLTTND
jgi:hypothetical protein